MIERLPTMLRALWFGQKLRRSAQIKDWAAGTSALSALLMLALPWLQTRGYLPGDITLAQANDLTTAISSALLLAASYFFRATSADVGFGSGEYRELPPPMVGDDGGAPVDYVDGGVLGRGRVARTQLHPERSTDHHPGRDPGLEDFLR